MRRLLQRGLSAATVTCGLFFAGQALAGGSGMPWEGPLQQIVESITGPVVQAAAVVAVVLFGAGVAMSENGSSMRRGLGMPIPQATARATSIHHRASATGTTPSPQRAKPKAIGADVGARRDGHDGRLRRPVRSRILDCSLHRPGAGEGGLLLVTCRSVRLKPEFDRTV